MLKYSVVKYSVVKPLYKKGEKHCISNYRPISNDLIFKRL